MSDEERKAIESFKEENDNDLSRFDDFNSYTQFKVKRDKIIIELIEKQSKEIENSTPNDKIKAKIEEINNEMINEENSLELFYRKKYCKEVLQSLLESR